MKVSRSKTLVLRPLQAEQLVVEERVNKNLKVHSPCSFRLQNRETEALGKRLLVALKASVIKSDAAALHFSHFQTLRA